MSTDALLDEATRLATMTQEDITLPWRHAEALAPIVRALVERVREAEAERQEWADLWQQASMSVLTLQDDAKTLTRERDEARGKLDKVRALADEAPDNLLDELRTLLAILDGKTGD